jgi:hypothetical protein
MRKTLHEYVIDCYYNNKIENDGVSEQLLIDIIYFAKLTNREPELGDFIPCDEEGNPFPLTQKVSFVNGENVENWEISKEYKAAKDRVIFKGDWEVVKLGSDYIILANEKDSISFWYSGKVQVFGKSITRIEDLPREIEFKDGVI